jgi:hypothetical protein
LAAAEVFYQNIKLRQHAQKQVAPCRLPPIERDALLAAVSDFPKQGMPLPARFG